MLQTGPNGVAMIQRDIFGLKNDVKSEIGVFWSAQYQSWRRRIENYDRGAADGNRAETPSLSKFSESCARDMTGFGLIVEFT
jgi:hypothetical protein